MSVNFLDQTRLVQEVPGVPVEDRWFIWHNHKTVWKGPTKEDGEAYAAANGIAIERVEYFEP